MAGGEDAGGPTSHYSMPTRVMACVWITVAVLLLLDVFWRGEGRSAWIAGAVLTASISLVYLVWVRPRVVSTERGIRMVNPLKETFVPWSAVLWVDVVDVLRVHTPEKVVRSWPLRETKRAKVRENLRRESGPLESGGEGETAVRPVDMMAHDLRRDAERYKAQPLSGPVKGVDESGPAAIGVSDRPQSMVPVEVLVVLCLTGALLVAVFLLA